MKKIIKIKKSYIFIITLLSILFILDSCNVSYKITEFKCKNEAVQNLLNDSSIYVRNGIRYNTKDVPLNINRDTFKTINKIVLSNNQEEALNTIFYNKREFHSYQIPVGFDIPANLHPYKIPINFNNLNESSINKCSKIQPDISFSFVKDADNLELNQNEILLNLKVKEILIARKGEQDGILVLSSSIPPILGLFIWGSNEENK